MTRDINPIGQVMCAKYLDETCVCEVGLYGCKRERMAEGGGMKLEGRSCPHSPGNECVNRTICDMRGCMHLDPPLIGKPLVNREHADASIVHGLYCRKSGPYGGCVHPACDCKPPITHVRGKRVAPDPPRAPTIEERVVALEKQVADISRRLMPYTPDAAETARLPTEQHDYAKRGGTMLKPGRMGCPHCGYRHPPDGMCVADNWNPL